MPPLGRSTWRNEIKMFKNTPLSKNSEHCQTYPCVTQFYPPPYMNAEQTALHQAAIQSVSAAQGIAEPGAGSTFVLPMVCVLCGTLSFAGVSEQMIRTMVGIADGQSSQPEGRNN